MQDYKKLKIWSRSLDLSVEIYNLTEKFPDNEKYGLTSQMRRAAASVPANIAEGCGRSSSKELLNFLSISNGSLNELSTFVEIASRLKIVSNSESIDTLSEIEELKKMIFSFRKQLK